MRVRGAAILAVLSAFAPACGGGGGGDGGSAPPPVLTPLLPVDTSSPDHSIDASQSDFDVTQDLKAAVAAGGTIVFINAPTPRTIVLTEQMTLPANMTAIIDGNDTITLSGGNAHRILRKMDNAVLTVQRLKFENARDTNEGAAIFTDTFHGRLTVINCQFTNCKTTSPGADIGGGAIRANGQLRLQVSGCTFTDCDGSNGGAIASIGSQITLVNCTFTQCDAFGTGGGGSGMGGIGGAVYVDGVSQEGEQHRLDIANCTFTSNTAKDHGGALFVFTYPASGSVVTIDQSTFSGNSVTDPSGLGLGGAVYHQDNRLTISRSTFDGNTTIEQGGGLWSICDSSTIENSTFQGNQATAATGMGGAIRIHGSALIGSCTIAQNHAGLFAGGILANTPSSMTLRNSLLMENTGTEPFNGWNVNATLGHGSNNLQWPVDRPGTGQNDTPARPSITFANAGLGLLLNNGGPTRTMAITGPPAVDAGNASAPEADQRGTLRLNAPDIGAFEKNP